MKLVVSLLAGFLLTQAQPTLEYTIHAIRYGTLPEYRVASRVIGAPRDERLDIAMVIWLIRSGGRTILLDSGFYRQARMERSGIVD